MSQLVDLITQWEAFTAAQPAGSLADFGRWLSAAAERKERFTAEDPAFGRYSAARQSMQAGYLIGKLHGYLQLYAKPLMKRHGLHSLDDYGYLATVGWHGTIAKSQACASMLQELTTGGDIIRRLAGRGLLKEIGDQKDRRRRLLQLTARGRKVLESVQRDFAGLPDVLGDLDAGSREQLVSWLAGLDAHHDAVVKDRKTGTI